MEQYELVMTLRAQSELSQILHYGAEQYGPWESLMYIREIEKKCERLCVFPEQYSFDEYSKSRNSYRSFSYKAHKIIYWVDDKNHKVFVITVRHNRAQDPSE